MNPKRQLLFLNLYNVLFSLRIADGVWVVFLLARGFSLVEVGLAQSVYSLISFVGEIPSGMAADLLGRKRTLAAAGLCGVLASLLMGFSQNLFGICVSMAFQALMFNLRSGTQQALAYDTLKAVGREREYPRANAILRVVSRVSASLSSLLEVLPLCWDICPPIFSTLFLGWLAAHAHWVSRNPKSRRPNGSKTSTPLRGWVPA